MCKRKIATMTRKYYNHTLQTNPRYREEATENINSQLTLKSKLSKATSFFFPSEVIAKTIMHNKTSTKHKTLQNNGGSNKQCINNNRSTALERSTKVTGTGVVLDRIDS